MEYLEKNIKNNPPFLHFEICLVIDLYFCIGNHTFQQRFQHFCSTAFASNEEEQNLSLFQKYDNSTLALPKELIMQHLANRIPAKIRTIFRKKLWQTLVCPMAWF